MVIKSPEKNPVDPAVNPNEEMEVKREPQSPTYSPPPDADALQITGQKRARSPLSDGSQGREKKSQEKQEGEAEKKATRLGFVVVRKKRRRKSTKKSEEENSA